MYTINFKHCLTDLHIGLFDYIVTQKVQLAFASFSPFHRLFFHFVRYVKRAFIVPVYIRQCHHVKDRSEQNQLQHLMCHFVSVVILRKIATLNNNNFYSAIIHHHHHHHHRDHHQFKLPTILCDWCCV